MSAGAQRQSKDKDPLIEIGLSGLSTSRLLIISGQPKIFREPWLAYLTNDHSHKDTLLTVHYW